jgi:hypothetical protein
VAKQEQEQPDIPGIRGDDMGISNLSACSDGLIRAVAELEAVLASGR